MEILSVRQQPEWASRATAYFQAKWPSINGMLYQDCIAHALKADGPLPQWYLLLEGEEIIGCAGLIPNDFISRMDLWPWICGLYIEQAHRGKALGAKLLNHARADADRLGFDKVYLCTDHVGCYEKYGFTYLGTGYHPWGEISRIYEAPARVEAEQTTPNDYIRPMTAGDYPAAYALWNAIPGMGMRSLDDTEAGIRKFLLHNPGTCFVAENGGTLTGTILCGQDGRRGYIYHVCVDPSCRRGGTGKALVDAALEGLRRAGINKVALVVFKDNLPGNSFWSATGWERREDLYYYNRSLNKDNI